MEEKRRERREQSKRLAVLIRANSTVLPVQIIDVAKHGVGVSLHTDPKLPEGEPVRLKYRDVVLDGYVRRTVRVGLVFSVGIEISDGDGMQLKD